MQTRGKYDTALINVIVQVYAKLVPIPIRDYCIVFLAQLTNGHGNRFMGRKRDLNNMLFRTLPLVYLFTIQ